MNTGLDSKWLHPLVKCKVEELTSEVPFTDGPQLQGSPVLWNLDVYIVGTSGYYESDRFKLLKYSTTYKSWSSFPFSCHSVHTTPVLTVYQFKLLLIDDNGEILEFSESTFRKLFDIPCLMTHSNKVVAAASEGKYLLVVCRERYKGWMSINMFNGNHWIVRDGPCSITRLQFFDEDVKVNAIIHKSTVFLAEWSGRISSLHKIPFQSLLDNEPDMWQVLNSALRVTHDAIQCGLLVLGQNLHIASWKWDDRIHLWCYTKSGCFEVANTEIFLQAGQIVGLPDESLMSIGPGEYADILPSFKLKPQGTAIS